MDEIINVVRNEEINKNEDNNARENSSKDIFVIDTNIRPVDGENIWYEIYLRYMREENYHVKNDISDFTTLNM